MVKIFSILTLLVTMAAAYLGFEAKNLNEQFRTRSDTEHKNLLEKTATLKKTEETLKTTQADLETKKEELATTKATLVTTQEDLTKTKGELDATKTMLAEKDTKIAALEKQIVESTPKTAPGEDPAKALANLVKEKADLEIKNKELEIVKVDLSAKKESLEARVKELDDKIAPLNAQIEKYKRGIMEEGLTGRVLAVNAGWGFCVLSIGDNKGAAANRVLIVRRGGQAIGRVKITAVESSQSVADIITGSFEKGTYIQPGDEVIYKKGSEGVKATEGDGAAGGGTPQPAQLTLPRQE